MRNVFGRSGTAFLLLIFLSAMAAGCRLSADSYDDGSVNGASSSTLAIVPSSHSMSASTSFTFSATGGAAPYYYVVAAGSGVISSAGVYTAPATVGTALIRVIDSNGATRDATVTIANPALAISPTTRTIAPGASYTFSATGGSAPYVYSLASGAGAVTASGTYTAPAYPGSASVRVTDSVGATSTAAITISGTTLTLTPNTKTLNVSGTQQFSVSGGTPPYAFSVSTGTGTVDASGNYTAPASPGIEKVRVTDGAGDIREATVTVENVNTYNMCTDISSSASSGTLYDSGGPGANYTDNEACGFLIQVPGASSITLTFNSFATEPWADYVRVFDGVDMSAVPLFSSNGYSGSLAVFSVTAHSGSMYVYLGTTASVTSAGFEASWTVTTSTAGVSPPIASFLVSAPVVRINDSITYTDASTGSPTGWLWDWFGDGSFNARGSSVAYAFPIHQNGMRKVRQLVASSGGSSSIIRQIKVKDDVRMCVGSNVTTDPEGELWDHARDGYYNGGQACSLLIQPAGASSITLNFNTFWTYDANDYLLVYDGVNSSAPLLANLSGSPAVAPITSSGGALYLEWRSDGANSHQGFQGTWTSTAPPKADFFTSYPTVTAGESVIFHDSSLNTATSWSWDFNADTVADAATQNPAHVFATSGDHTVSLTATNAYGSTSVTKTVSVQPAYTLCADTTGTSLSGTLYDSGGKSGFYGNNESCGFLIQPPAVSTVVLDFTLFAVEHNLDHVRVYDGTSSSGTPLFSGMGLTGGKLPPTLSANSGAMYIEMVTDGSGTTGGIRANWSSY